MSEKNWIALHDDLEQYLPNDGRPYTELEAMFSLTLDKKNDIERSISQYAFIWNWSRTKARTFLDDCQSASGFLKNSKKTGKKHPIWLISKAVQRLKNEQKTDKKQVEEEYDIPEWEEFKSYALTVKHDVNVEIMKAKYDAWKLDGWKDGKGKKIKNWRSKIGHNIQYWGIEKDLTGRKPLKKIYYD